MVPFAEAERIARDFEQNVEFLALEDKLVDRHLGIEIEKPRTPVVVLLGHFDHGKVSIWALATIILHLGRYWGFSASLDFLNVIDSSLIITPVKFLLDNSPGCSWWPRSGVHLRSRGDHPGGAHAAGRPEPMAGSWQPRPSRGTSSGERAARSRGFDSSLWLYVSCQ